MIYCTPRSDTVLREARFVSYKCCPPQHGKTLPTIVVTRQPGVTNITVELILSNFEEIMEENITLKVRENSDPSLSRTNAT